MAPGAVFLSRASRRKRKSDDLKWSVTTEDGRKRPSSVFTAARWRHVGVRERVRERGSSHKKEEDPVKPVCRPAVPARWVGSTWWCGCCG